MMIPKIGKGEVVFMETEFSQPQRKPKSGASSLCKGFVEGFGSIGYVFRNPQQSRKRPSLATQLAKAPVTERRAIATMAKRQMAVKYVGKAMANKLCSVSTGTREGRARRVDALMIHRDFAMAISKIHD
jgi:hypothetical protein